MYIASIIGWLRLLKEHIIDRVFPMTTGVFSYCYQEWSIFLPQFHVYYKKQLVTETYKHFHTKVHFGPYMKLFVFSPRGVGNTAVM